MEFKHEIKGNALVLKLTGDLIGEDNGAAIIGVVVEALQQRVATCLVDISAVRYINSAGIGVLITILTKFRNKNGEVYLMNPSESVQKLLVITKLNNIFHMVHAESEVIK